MGVHAGSCEILWSLSFGSVMDDSVVRILPFELGGMIPPNIPNDETTWESQLVAKILTTCGPSCVALLTNFYFTKEGKDGGLMKSEEKTGYGSGFVVKGQRIYTSVHVVCKKDMTVQFGEESFVAEGLAKSIKVFSNVGKSPRFAYIERISENWRIALLRFMDEGVPIPIPIPEIEILSRRLYSGETVVAISCTWGHQNTIHKGMVNHPNVLGVLPNIGVIDHDCHLDNGSSGAPILSFGGFVGAMNQTIGGWTEKSGYAVISSCLQLFLDETLSLDLIGAVNHPDKLLPEPGPSGSVAPSFVKRRRKKNKAKFSEANLLVREVSGWNTADEGDFVAQLGDVTESDSTAST